MNTDNIMAGVEEFLAGDAGQDTSADETTDSNYIAKTRSLLMLFPVCGDVEIILDTSQIPTGEIAFLITMESRETGIIAAIGITDVQTAPENFYAVHADTMEYISRAITLWSNTPKSDRQPLINLIEYHLDSHGEFPPSCTGGAEGKEIEKRRNAALQVLRDEVYLD